MELNNILASDMLDIVFDGRNKEYGAYQLRKNYNKRLHTAIIIMLSFCLLLFCSAFIVSKNKISTVAPPTFVEVDILPVVTPKIIPPVVQKIKPRLQQVKITKSTPPKIVNDDKVVTPPPDQDMLTNSKIGDINQNGSNTDIIPPPLSGGAGTGNSPVKEKDSNVVFTTVQIEARFKGDWSKYLQRNLNASIAAENGAPAGDYSVVVSFVVGKDGSISEVQALNDPGYGTAAEAVHIIQKGPEWIPAMQNGRNVIYRQKQKIIFQVQE